MDKRKTSFKKYGISQKRYKELSGFCEQYPEWKDELRFNQPMAKSQRIDGMPFSNTNTTSDETAELAIKRADIQSKVDMIENSAKEAAPDIWEYLIKSVCYEKSFWYMRDILMIPCSERSFYDKRRYFFYLLDKKKK